MSFVDGDTLFDYLYTNLPILVLSKEDDADLLNELVPDIIVRGLDGGDIVLDGNTFFYESITGSGEYLISWRPVNPNAGRLVFGGTSFLINTTVVYDNENNQIGVMTEPAGDCSKYDYSENGDVVEMTAPGGKSNILRWAVFLGKIELGG
jgi:hypothetical protein